MNKRAAQIATRTTVAFISLEPEEMDDRLEQCMITHMDEE